MRRFALCVLLTPFLAYVMLIAQAMVTAILLGEIPPAGELRLNFDPRDYSIEVVLILIVLSFAQLAALLIPLPLQPSRSEPVPILSRALLGGFLVTAAIAVPLVALLDIPDYFLSDAKRVVENVKDATPLTLARVVITSWALSWIFFTALLTYRSRTPGTNAIEQSVKQATFGTAVGLALTIPWYLVLRRKQHCVCALGTFYSLLLGIWSLIMISGPLLFVLRRDRERRNASQDTPSV